MFLEAPFTEPPATAWGWTIMIHLSPPKPHQKSGEKALFFLVSCLASRGLTEESGLSGVCASVDLDVECTGPLLPLDGHLDYTDIRCYILSIVMRCHGAYSEKVLLKEYSFINFIYEIQPFVHLITQCVE